MNPYETEQLLAEYLLFHYGSAEEVLPWPQGPREALDYPVRCVTECAEVAALPAGARGLDLGCAVGRSTFELAQHCAEVVGIDYSHRFIEAANVLLHDGAIPYLRKDEGTLSTPLVARRPAGVNGSGIRFETGDAMNLRADLGSFDVVLGANLIDRLSDPARFLTRLPSLVKPGGQLILTSPYTWLPEFTPAEHWVGGCERDGKRVTTLDGLHTALDPHFTLVSTKDLPFLIREHARKFQWSIAQASIWRRR